MIVLLYGLHWCVSLAIDETSICMRLKGFYVRASIGILYIRLWML